MNLFDKIDSQEKWELFLSFNGGYISFPAIWWHRREMFRCNYIDKRNMVSNTVYGEEFGFPYLNPEKPGLIFYTPSDDKGERDIQVPIRFGKFFRKFFPEDTDEEIKQKVNKLVLAIGVDDIKLEMARTADEIEEVYQNGPPSCMKFSPYEEEEEGHSSPEHPCRVYAKFGDVAIGYIKRGDKIMARAAINMKNNTYHTIYGYKEVMEKVLSNNGITQCDKGLHGCKIEKVPFEDTLVCPYLDGYQGLIDIGPHLVIVRDKDGRSQFAGTTEHGVAYASEWYEEEEESDCSLEERLDPIPF